MNQSINQSIGQVYSLKGPVLLGGGILPLLLLSKLPPSLLYRLIGWYFKLFRKQDCPLGGLDEKVRKTGKDAKF